MPYAVARKSARFMVHTAARIGARGVRTIQRSLPLKQQLGFLDVLYRALTVLPAGAAKYSAMRFLAVQEYSTPMFTDLSDRTVSKVRKAAEAIYGDGWNSFSDALRPEVVRCLNASINHLRRHFERIDYLEIGSAQGVSMAFIGTALREAGIPGTLTSIDPYIEAGYSDSGYHVALGKDTKEKAERLYAALSLPVSIIERPSGNALVQLLKADGKFHLIYVDGLHSGLTPTLDFGLSYHLLHDRGVVMLDDHVSPDIVALKTLCDRYCDTVCECWKVACYTPRRP